MNKTLIVIAGPTAVGKTALSIALADHFTTEIISADSRQCYRELTIGVAKPAHAQLQQIPHHFINTHAITEMVTAADFEKQTMRVLDNIFTTQNIAIVTGGTGLYIKALCEGLDEIPAVPEDIRNNIIQQYKAHGLIWLQEQITVSDPDYALTGEMHNPQRLMRALEVKKATGHSIRSFQTKSKVKRDFNIIKIGLELPREKLYEQINQRVDEMMEAGLGKEVEALILYQHLPALQTVGYKELFDHFKGNISLETAVTLIKQNTRHYAKRQMTWFKRDADFHWCAPVEENVLSYLATKKIY